MPTKKRRAAWGTLPKKPVTWRTRLRTFRIHREMTQVEVAAECGLTVGTVSAAERGADVSLTTAIALAEFYGESVETLWFERVT